MADPIQFDRKPYFVTWKDESGEIRKIRRVPPPKLHEALPTDIVEISNKRSDDFKEGDEVSVKHINPRHPNVLQLENSDGQTTFVNYFDVKLKEKIAPRDGVPREQTPERNRYLLWP